MSRSEAAPELSEFLLFEAENAELRTHLKLARGRRDRAESAALEWRAERDSLAAVIESACAVWVDGIVEAKTVEDLSRLLEAMSDALIPDDPAVVLRSLKAKVWDEGHLAGIRDASWRAMHDLARAERKESDMCEARAEARGEAWASYRKDVQPNPLHFERERVAFKAGWDARDWQASREAHDDQCEAEYVNEAPGWTDCGCTDRRQASREVTDAEVLRKVRQARSNHPKCDVHPEGDPVSCGWKRVVLDIDAALEAAREVQS